ncbi:hypothetical protein BGZ49_001811, partial [Haplosporangium sp. Z 27]
QRWKAVAADAPEDDTVEVETTRALEVYIEETEAVDLEDDDETIQDPYHDPAMKSGIKLRYNCALSNSPPTITSDSIKWIKQNSGNCLLNVLWNGFSLRRSSMEAPHTIVAISSTRDKEQDARSFGAHEFICTKEPLNSTTKMDYILNTVAGNVDWEYFINLLDSNGTLINMGVSHKPTMDIPSLPTIFKQLKVVGSLVASRHVVMKMLDFAALHNIKPEIQELEMGVKGCREACRLVTEQKARYRVK